MEEKRYMTVKLTVTENGQRIETEVAVESYNEISEVMLALRQSIFNATSDVTAEKLRKMDENKNLTEQINYMASTNDEPRISEKQIKILEEKLGNAKAAQLYTKRDGSLISMNEARDVVKDVLRKIR